MSSRSSSTKRNSVAKDKKSTSGAQSNEWKAIEKRLIRAAREKNRALRGVRIAAVMAQALRTIGQEPVLVGGAAVEFYTHGAYTTKDIDMVAPGGPALKDLMTKMGFARIGKDFVHEELNIYIEFPSAYLARGEAVQTVTIDDTNLEIISLEDLIVDRLCAYKFWKSGIDGVNAMILMELGEDTRATTERKALAQDVIDAMDYIRIVRERVIRERLSKEDASALIEKFVASRR